MHQRLIVRFAAMTVCREYLRKLWLFLFQLTPLSSWVLDNRFVSTHHRSGFLPEVYSFCCLMKDFVPDCLPSQVINRMKTSFSHTLHTFVTGNKDPVHCSCRIINSVFIKKMSLPQNCITVNLFLWINANVGTVHLLWSFSKSIKPWCRSTDTWQHATNLVGDISCLWPISVHVSNPDKARRDVTRASIFRFTGLLPINRMVRRNI